jgi:hypothetical protein
MNVRAGIFIGVDQVGELPRLRDAAAGAQRMYEWGVAQGMTPVTHAKLITDAEGKVRAEQIIDAIEELVKGAGVDQLIVYFAGHGINVNRNEHWLLTEAPGRANAAVNVSGSVELARYCGIPHVVVISDACRVAPEGIQAQGVRGQDIFPNDGAGDRAKPVDQFFACTLGRTAAEVKDPQNAAAMYRALYTGAMLEALEGKVFEVLEALAEGSAEEGRCVRPRKLEDYLEREIPRRVRAMNLQNTVNQSPDAILLDHRNWLARVTAAEALAAKATGLAVGFAAEARARAETLRGVTESLVHSAAQGDRAAVSQGLQDAVGAPVRAARDMARTMQKVETPFGPDHFETGCGIKVRGATITGMVANRAQGQLLGNELVRIDRVDGPAATVVVRFGDGTGTLVPVMPGFLAALTFDDGELIDVAYEPSAGDWRYPLYRQEEGYIRSLRAIAAASSRHGRFRLDNKEAESIGRKMQWMKGVDPTLAVYAAYAYHDLQLTERLRRMLDYQRGELHASFFDLSLTSRELVGRGVAPEMNVVPFAPLLAQGWELVRANRVKTHPTLEGIERNLRDSLWSLYDEAGVAKLVRAMESGAVR